MIKKTVLFIGEGIQCSQKVLWHLIILGYLLTELLKKDYNLIEVLRMSGKSKLVEFQSEAKPSLTLFLLNM